MLPEDIAIEYDATTGMFVISVWDYTCCCWDEAAFAYSAKAAETTVTELRASIEEAQYEAAGTPEH